MPKKTDTTKIWNTKQKQVWIDNEQYDLLQIIKDNTGASIAWLVRKGVTMLLESYKKEGGK